MTIPVSGGDATVRMETEYIGGPACQLLVTRFMPSIRTDSRGTVLCLPPFAEEMNKSRRMLALQGRALAQKGISFVLPDVRGTGDSEGEFGEATWEAWRLDICSIVDWLRFEGGVRQIDVLALRSGVFLGGNFLETTGIGPKRLALWSPVHSGRVMIDNLFRTMLIRGTGGISVKSVAEVRERVATNGSLEVAGYWLSEELVRSVDALEISNVQLASGCQVLWADASPATVDRVPRKTEKVLRSWASGNVSAEYTRFVGPQFWMGPEIELIPDLLEKTTAFFLD